MKKTPIILIGFGDAASGFARVVHSIARHLPKKYEVHHLAVNILGQVNGTYPWKMYANDLEGDWLGGWKLRQMIKDIQPEVVWFLNDFWYLAKYYRLLQEHKGQFKSVAYVPLDGKIVEAGLLGAMQFFDQVVVYNQFSKQELKEQFKLVASTDSDFIIPPVSIIPHGVNQELFFPLDRKFKDDNACAVKAREQLYGRDCSFKDGFIVLNANQNAQRKCYEITLEGFAAFAKNKPDNVKLHIHCQSGANSQSLGVLDIQALADKLDIADRLILTNPPFSDSKLNLLYNACDVGINTSWGEGWGLVSFEHAATGAAQIVPRHTACKALWKNAAEFLNADEILREPANILEKRITNANEVARALEKLYVNSNYLEQMSLAAYTRATQPNFQWENIGLEWDKCFTSLLKQPLKAS